MNVRERFKAAAIAILAAVRWVFRMLVRGLRAYGQFLWKGIKISVMIGLLLGTLGAINNFSLGLGDRSRR